MKIGDFGWASLIDEKDVRKSVCGTPEYMPPEVIDNVPHDLKIDIWMLGVLLFEMLHGHTPYQGNHTSLIKEQIFSQPIIINQNLSSEIKELLKFILKKNSNMRPTSQEILDHPLVSKYQDN